MPSSPSNGRSFACWPTGVLRIVVRRLLALVEPAHEVIEPAVLQHQHHHVLDELAVHPVALRRIGVGVEDVLQRLLLAAQRVLPRQVDLAAKFLAHEVLFRHVPLVALQLPVAWREQIGLAFQRLFGQRLEGGLRFEIRTGLPGHLPPRAARRKGDAHVGARPGDEGGARALRIGGCAHALRAVVEDELHPQARREGPYALLFFDQEARVERPVGLPLEGEAQLLLVTGLHRFLAEGLFGVLEGGRGLHSALDLQIEGRAGREPLTLHHPLLATLGRLARDPPASDHERHLGRSEVVRARIGRAQGDVEGGRRRLGAGFHPRDLDGNVLLRLQLPLHLLDGLFQLLPLFSPHCLGFRRHAARLDHRLRVQVSHQGAQRLQHHLAEGVADSAVHGRHCVVSRPGAGLHVQASQKDGEDSAVVAVLLRLHLRRGLHRQLGGEVLHLEELLDQLLCLGRIALLQRVEVHELAIRGVEGQQAPVPVVPVHRKEQDARGLRQEALLVHLQRPSPQRLRPAERVAKCPGVAVLAARHHGGLDPEHALVEVAQRAVHLAGGADRHPIVEQRVAHPALRVAERVEIVPAQLLAAAGEGVRVVVHHHVPGHRASLRWNRAVAAG